MPEKVSDTCGVRHHGSTRPTLGAVKEYYDTRAPEYDDWYLGRGLFTGRERPGWDGELAELVAVISSLPPKRTLDVACGTGFLTRHLRGDVLGLDQSARMLDEARRQAPNATYVQGDALALPVPDRSFDRVFTGHFYGHLERAECDRFLAEARRVAPELVIVDAARGAGDGIEEHMSPRVLNDGSTWQVFKRYFTGSQLLAELGGGDILLEGRQFLVVRA
jgi:demethylmenaquinone methyltransferase/2-methoxy-6-polyprenyl-1,4-benzoquinol methylase